MLSNIKGAIFDLDGTLVSSTLDFTSIRKQIGCPTDTDILSFVDKINCPDKRLNAHQHIESAELQDAADSSWLDGASDLMHYLTANQIKLAIVTRNSKTACQIKLDSFREDFDVVHTREDFPPKPAPDALLDIANRWSHDVDELIYIGDYIYDVQAAENAGMKSCLISGSSWESIKPDIHVKSLSELQNLFEQTIE